MWDIKIIEKEKSIEGNYTAVATWTDAEFGQFSIGFTVNETAKSQTDYQTYIIKYRDEWVARKVAEKTALLASQKAERDDIQGKLAVTLNAAKVK